MRYQSPSLEKVLDRLQTNKHLREIIVVPLFPQYAGATTGSVHQKVMEIIKDWPLIPKITLIDQYCDFEPMLDIYTENGKKYLDQEKYDKVLFSFHGLPLRQLQKADHDCQGKMDCCIPFGGRNYLCYRAQCVQTARKLAEKLSLKEDDYVITFQSRLGRAEWVKPYTDETIEHLAKTGCKKLLVFSPAFVSDCLETTIEIGEAYAEDFVEMGGEKLQLVESLNDDSRWVEALKQLVLRYSYQAESFTRSLQD
jgi:ferrochelatase